jgi:hypothetical protein
MTPDRLQLLKFGIISAVLIVGWFVLTSVTHNIVLQSLLGWIGLGVIALYYRWLKKNKVQPPKP